MPKKPCKFGVKVWVLAEGTTGYVLSFQVYTGDVLPSTSLEEHASKGLAYRVVMDLMEPYQGRRHQLFMDTFYTSVELTQEKGDILHRKNTPKPQKFPWGFESRQKIKTVLEFGKFQFATFSDLTTVLWRDRRDVFVLHNRSVDSYKAPPRRAGQDPHSLSNSNVTTTCLWAGLILQISSFLTTLSHRGVFSNGGRFFGVSLILLLSTLGFSYE